MNKLFWLAVIVFAGALVWLVWFVRRKAEERRLAKSRAPLAFVSELGPARRPSLRRPRCARPGAGRASPAPLGDIALQKLLFEAATRPAKGRSRAGNPLYARLPPVSGDSFADRRAPRRRR